MIIDQSVRELVWEIESSPPDINQKIIQLIQTLHNNLQTHSHTLTHLPTQQTAYTQYPLDEDGFAVAFDPLKDEEGFMAAFREHGLVVGKGVISSELCKKAVHRIQDVASLISNGQFDFSNPESWHGMPEDEHGTPLLSRGFFELYHDGVWAEIRQSIRLYIHHVLLWGRVDLWSSFDRFGVKLPNEDGKALGLHVDQNPTVHPEFRTLQGILALADNPKEQGTFRAVPGSRKDFHGYIPFVKNKGEYVALEEGSELSEKLNSYQQAFPLRAGDIVTWDSRTTHANTSNLSDSTRYVAMVAMGPAPENFSEMSAVRQEAFESGLGSNVRDALMHASMKPRFTNSSVMNAVRQPEHLNQLGAYLYGFEPYEL